MSDLLNLKKTINSFNKVSLLAFRDTLSSLLKNDESEFITFIINKLQMSKNAKLKKEIVHAIEANPKTVYIPILLSMLEQETDIALVNVICKALISTESKEAIEGMIEISKKRTTAGAIKSIESHIKKTSSKEPIEFYVNNIFKGSSDAKSSLHAVNVLLRLGNEKILPEMFKKLESANNYMAINNALSVMNGFDISEENAFTLIEFLHKNIDNYHRINILTKVIESLFKEEKDKILSIAVSGLAEYGMEDEKKLKKHIDKGEKQIAIKIAEKIISEKKDFFTFELSSYITLLLENRVTEAKAKLEQFEKKVAINRKLQSAIVNNNFTAVSKLPTEKLIAMKDKFINKILEMLKLTDEQVSSGAASLAGSCFEISDIEILEILESSKVAKTRLEFVKQLGIRQCDDFYKILLTFSLNDKSLDVRQQAILSLSKLPSIKNNLDNLIDSDEIDKIIIAIKIIKEQKLKSYEHKLSEMIDTKSDNVVSEIFDAFSLIGSLEYYDKIKNYISIGKSNINRSKAIKLLPIMDTEKSTEDLYKLSLIVKEVELKASIIEALHEAIAENNLSDMDNIRALLEILAELINSEKYLKVSVEIGPMFNVTQKLYYAKLKEMLENKLSILRHAPKWDKKLLSEIEVAIKDCNQKMIELEKIKEIGNRIRHFILKLKNENDNGYLIQIASELKDLLNSEHHLLDDEIKISTLSDLFLKLNKIDNDWKTKRVLIETIGEVINENEIGKLKPYIIDNSRAVRIESKKAILKTGLEPVEIPSIIIKKILVDDSSKFFKNKIYNYLINNSNLFEGKNCNIINFEGNVISDDIDLYIVDENTYTKLKLGDKKCFSIITYTIMENVKKEEYEKKGVILLQKPFIMQEIDKKIILFFR